jgi:nitrite reductase/ring-hydroxylating ferredoxin subunit
VALREVPAYNAGSSEIGMVLKNIGPVANFPVNKGVCIDVDGTKVAVFNVTGQYYAIEDTCPHRGASFSQGMVAGTSVNCPWHGAEVDVRTGLCGPPAPRAVKTWDVSCDGNQLFIDV